MGTAEIVSKRVEGDLHRYTYADAERRACRVAHALDRMAVDAGERVATLAWNGYRHFELYFGVSGSGRVLHTVNPRLAPDQIAWIVNHAEDRALCFDMTFLPIIKGIWRHCPTVKHWIALCDAAALPADSGIEGLQSYEAWIEPRERPLQLARASTSVRPRRFATPAAPPATPRACSTAIARRCCTPMPVRCPMH